MCRAQRETGFIGSYLDSIHTVRQGFSYQKHFISLCTFFFFFFSKRKPLQCDVADKGGQASRQLSTVHRLSTLSREMNLILLSEAQRVVLNSSEFPSHSNIEFSLHLLFLPFFSFFLSFENVQLLTPPPSPVATKGCKTPPHTADWHSHGAPCSQLHSLSSSNFFPGLLLWSAKATTHTCSLFSLSLSLSLCSPPSLTLIISACIE